MKMMPATEKKHNLYISGCNMKSVTDPVTFLISKAVYCVLRLRLIAQVSKLPTDTKHLELTANCLPEVNIKLYRNGYQSL